jgi:STE24 endopeptidase
MKIRRRFEIKKRKIAQEYNKLRRRWNIIYTIFNLLLLSIFLISGASLGLKNFLSNYLREDWLLNTFYFLILLISLEIINLPSSYHLNFYLEHKFNLSNQKIKAFFIEKIKKLALTLLLGLLSVHTIYYFLKYKPDYWWIYTSFIFILLGILLSHLAPKILIPIFYKLIPIEDEELRESILNLCKEKNTKVKEVYKIDLSRDTKKANAGLTGIGNTRCIILSDTLLNRFTLEEIEVVFAHELGHHYHGHLWKLLGVEIFISFLIFYLLDINLRYLSFYFNIQEIHNIANLPLLVLIFYFFSFLFLPLKNSISKRLEKQADIFAIESTSKPSSFISSMIALGDQNLSELKAHPLIEFFFYSHPSLLDRLKMGYRMLKR